MKRGRVEVIVEEVRAAMAKWPDFAEQANVMDEWRKQIQRHLRLDFTTHIKTQYRIRRLSKSFCFFEG